MEITEEHIQEELDRLEEYSIIRAKNNDEAHGVMFAALRMRTRLLCRLRAKSEEDYQLSEEYAKECMRILRETDGDLLSYTYKCGHKIVPIILNTNVDSLATYMEWKESNSGLCLVCWLEQKKTSKELADKIENLGT